MSVRLRTRAATGLAIIDKNGVVVDNGEGDGVNIGVGHDGLTDSAERCLPNGTAESPANYPWHGLRVDTTPCEGGTGCHVNGSEGRACHIRRTIAPSSFSLSPTTSLTVSLPGGSTLRTSSPAIRSTERASASRPRTCRALRWGSQ